MIYEVGTQSKSMYDLKDGPQLPYLARYIVRAKSIDEAIAMARAHDLSQEVTDAKRLEQYTGMICE